MTTPGKRGKVSLWDLFYKKLHPHDLITFQRPHLLLPPPLWVRISTLEFGDDPNIQTMASMVYPHYPSLSLLERYALYFILDLLEKNHSNSLQPILSTLHPNPLESLYLCTHLWLWCDFASNGWYLWLFYRTVLSFLDPVCSMSESSKILGICIPHPLIALGQLATNDQQQRNRV